MTNTDGEHLVDVEIRIFSGDEGAGGYSVYR